MKYQKDSQKLIKADEKTRKGQKEKFGNDLFLFLFTDKEHDYVVAY